MSCLMTGGPGKEQGTNKPPPTGRVKERTKGDTTCLTTSQNPSFWHPSWLNKASEWLAEDNLETNPITIKPKTASYVVELFSWVPLSYCSPLGCSFPIKYLALSAHVFPQTIHFQVLDKSPVSGPGRGPPSCNSLVSLLSKGLSRVFSNKTFRKHQFFGAQASLWSNCCRKGGPLPGTETGLLSNTWK